MNAEAPSFGPHLYEVKLHVNKPFGWDTTLPIVLDVETDEKDNFVGIACKQPERDIFYFTKIEDSLKLALESLPLIGHNLKGDMKWLKGWGVDVKSSQLFYDTCLASYVQNTTKESHGLKTLAKEILGMEWPSYKDMTTVNGKEFKPETQKILGIKNRNNIKLTLDKQPVERVAAYCGMDCLATYRLWQHFQKVLSVTERRYLEGIELPTARVLLDMELMGAKVDIEYLEELKHTFSLTLNSIETQIKQQWIAVTKIEPDLTRDKKDTELNVNSNRQIAELLEFQGAVLPLTTKGNKKVDKQTLCQWLHLPVVPLLLEYSKIEKILNTYVLPLLEKNKDGRIYCSYNQITKGDKGQTAGISTGRLSSSGPNLQNIPSRTEEGKLIRKAFVAPEGKTLLDADFSQIEPRLVAHFSKDPLFIRAFKDDRDIYQELVEGTGRDRQDGKTFMLALLYGAQPKKLASVFKCSEKEAQNIIDRIMKKLPGVKAWKTRVIFEAKRRGGVTTLFKRFIPLPGLKSDNPYERMHWERVAVNTVIQGSAAEIMKLGLIKLNEAGFNLTITVHDEYVIETDGTHKDKADVKNILEKIVSLDVPLKVEIGLGKNWQEAKG